MMYRGVLARVSPWVLAGSLLLGGCGGCGPNTGPDDNGTGTDAGQTGNNDGGGVVGSSSGGTSGVSQGSSSRMGSSSGAMSSGGGSSSVGASSTVGSSVGASSVGASSTMASSSGVASSGPQPGAPSVVFVAPANAGGAVTLPVGTGDRITFTAAVTDDVAILPQNGSFTVTPPAGAASNNQGTVAGTGASVQASLDITFNAAGTWTVAYTYQDATALSATATLTVNVAADPGANITITAPANDGVTVVGDVRENSAVIFRATVADNNAILPQNIQWTFTPVTGAPTTGQGVIMGAGVSVTSTLTVPSAGPAGTASVTISYVDQGNTTTMRTLAVPVLSANAPSILFTSPANNGAVANRPYRQGETIQFAATVSDDAAINAANLAWALTSPTGAVTAPVGGYAVGGTPNTGTATLAASLQDVGAWRVSLTYTDATALSRTAVLIINVEANQPPTCVIADPGACVPAGQLVLEVTLSDPDGDTPITAVLGSSVVGDVVPMMVTGTGRRQVTVTLNGTGMHTLSCTPTDSANAQGTTASWLINVIGTGPTVAIGTPTPNTIVAQGSNLAVTASGTVDPGAAPGVLTLVDSVAGTVTLTAGSGTVTAPTLGFHDLRAAMADACNNVARATVRYAVTVGGAPAASLTRPTGLQQDTRALAPGVNGTLLVGTNGNGLRRVDPANAQNSQQVDPSTMGDNLPGPEVTAIAQGSGMDHLAAYGTRDGVLLCVVTGATSNCVERTDNTNPSLLNVQVTGVAVAGNGTADNEALFVVATTDGVQFFGPTGDLLHSVNVNPPNGLPGEPVAVLVDPTGTNLDAATPLANRTLRVWVATPDGLARVSAAPPPSFGTVTVETFTTQNTNNGLPGNTVRALALDPGNPQVLYVATSAGLCVHTGPMVDAASFAAVTRQSHGLTSDNLRAVTVDRYPNPAIPVVWLGTDNAGAMRVELTSAAPAALVTAITTADGLPGNRVNAILIHPDDTAHIKWFGTSNGVWGYAGQ